MWLSVVAVVIAQILVVLVAFGVPSDARGIWIPGQASEATPPTPGDPATPPIDLQTRFDELVGGYLAQHPEFTGAVAVGAGDYELTVGEEERFETASIVKVEILLRWLLARQDDGLPASEYALAERMITVSDNAATDELCLIIMGRTAPDEVPGGVDACTADGYWGSDETSAADQLKVLNEAVNSTRLKPESLAVARELMSSVSAGQDWGVSAAAGGDETVLVKNGWDDRSGWLVNSIGVIEGSSQLRITVLTFGHARYETGVAHVEELARLARQAIQPV